MLKDKHPKQPAPPAKEGAAVSVPEEAGLNPLAEIYHAVRRAILTIRENPDDPTGDSFFKTIAIDTGQFARIVRDENLETEAIFPAVFIHFVNVRYLVQQQRIGQGRATMRVRFILHTLNNGDADRECEAFEVFRKINVAIQDAKNYEPALNERCNLLYFDMPATVNMLQAYWVDYEVWFREASAWKYRDWVERYLVMPPFTNHNDAPENDKDGHGDHPEPADRQAIGIVPSVEEPLPPAEEGKDTSGT